MNEYRDLVARAVDTRMTEPIESRFWAKVEFTDECWLWRGGATGARYGAFSSREHRKTWMAHRFAYEFLIGPIPAGLELDHLCRVTLCVNPYHLEAVTHRENLRRADVALGVRSARSHCPHGHEYTPENTFTDKRNRRYCRSCQRAQRQSSRERKAVAA